MNFKRKNKTNRSLVKKNNVKGTFGVPKIVRMLVKDDMQD
jgi:hypothetical protein